MWNWGRGRERVKGVGWEGGGGVTESENVVHQECQCIILSSAMNEV